MNNTSALVCKDGLLLSAAAVTPRNALLYLAALLYCFLGIAIVADIFMCAIEQITSATRKVKRKTKTDRLVDAAKYDGEEYDEVKIWNPTVANLTLMALGSSAPEILLSIIEIVGNNFRAGELGPGTIVGSAAFNLLCISAICVLAVDSPDTKRIELYRVFLVTATFGTFAYIWLLIILVLITPNVVDVWEAAVTFALFFILVFVAYAVDVQMWIRPKKADLHEELEMDAEARLEAKRPSVEHVNEDIKRWASVASIQPDGSRVLVGNVPAPPFETVRKWTREVSRAYPSLSQEDQAKLLAYRVARTVPHDRLYYRIQACRMLSSSSRKSDEEQEIEETAKAQEQTDSKSRGRSTIEFAARVYSIDSHDKRVNLKIVRSGSLTTAATINYTTVNGVAKRDLHFLFKSETLKFAADESTKEISVELVDGANWRPNDVFYVQLRLQDIEESAEDDAPSDKIKLGPCNVARVRVPDDKASLMGEPVVEFVQGNYVVKENAKFVRTFVTRRGRKHSGSLRVHYETTDVTAESGLDYVAVPNGVVRFEGQEYEKYVDVQIIDDKMDEKDETFTIELLKTDDSEVSLGGKRRTTVTIISDDNVLKNVVNVHKLMAHYLSQFTPGQATWKQQIINATSVNSGDLANASFLDCVLHALAFPWKFVFAFLPPPTILNGYPCFLVALGAIGLVTALVGDIASIFGCMVGMKDAVTAITLVALGTSLPDTFASKIAAQNEDTADNAIGNVTGSNSVNVFLGLGLPWLIASVYWASKGEVFRVESGDLGFSVTIFMICSVLMLGLLVMRRKLPSFGRGELGGPVVPKIFSGAFFVLLWLVYVAMSIWKMHS
ncbi:unnamed protein product [Caenorhabditis auriculariae]|uniref:Calx-beta domain-containing protein n=1 Tax=Caenorhabditis auriculariae TaxID=2777116 RepID=A0A8S1H7I2_9PELO|nr:unnamed protein product [Caenorhabditis auriculariae]